MRTAIVTGANRGVGREIAKQLVVLGYRVLFTSRDDLRGKQSYDKLKGELETQRDGELVYHQLDVTDSKSMQRLYDFVVSEYGFADVLVNNAAVLLDPYGRNPANSAGNLPGYDRNQFVRSTGAEPDVHPEDAGT